MLEPQAREVLQVAAVIGREFPRALLAEMLRPDIDLTSAITRLTAARLIQLTQVRPDVTYRFMQAVTHEIAYESLLGFHRRSLHDSLGRALDSRLEATGRKRRPLIRRAAPGSHLGPIAESTCAD